MSLTLASSTVASNGGSVALVFSTAHGPVNPGAGAAGFSLSGTTATVASVSLVATTGVIFLNGVIYSTDTPTLNYDATNGNVHDSDAPPVYLGLLSNFPVTNNSTVSAPAGVYGDISDIRAEMGTYNEQIAANPDNSDNAQQIVLYEQKACDFADARINTRLALQSLATPATVNLPMLKIIFGMYGAWKLYAIRGLQDDKMGGKFQAKLDEADRQLDELLFMNRGGFTRPSGFTDAPVAVAPSVDASGNPVSDRPPYPVPRWDGYQWVWK